MRSLHHHTLYYYNQAGDLIRTVPPIGIDQTFFASPIPGATPNHKQITQYEYNTLGQVVRQETPDAGVTTFYYDEAQRLRLSQDAEQAQPTDDGSIEPVRYSYTKYDEQSRITEVGEVSGITQSDVDDILNLNQLDWPTTTDGTLRDQTITVYDDAATDSGIEQGLVRSRVSYTSNDDMTTYYSYDVHGNVRTLAHRIDNLATTYGDQIIEYDYDLISGNVKEVAYQRGQVDQFYHRYDYDADNRLTHVFTSEDDVIWEQDARYFYYLHGPLARMEAGHDQVQGMDYYYTLQGWIKGVNLHTLDDPDLDPGMDGAPTPNLNSLFARDEMAYALGYHDDDYRPIQNTPFGDKVNSLFSGSINTNLQGQKGLYNGNIATMATTIPTFDNSTGAQIGHELQAMSYKYDQLHRIKEAKAHALSGSAWALKTQNGIESYASTYTYDGNGNLQKLTRNSADAPRNHIEYEYEEVDGVFGNKLEGADDLGGFREFQYDKIGNIIFNQFDSQGVIHANTEWDVYGKIESVTKSDGTNTVYQYDPAGNRLSKADQDKTRYYIRDASGNIMATYLLENNALSQNEVNLYGSSRLGQRTFASVDRTIGNVANALKLSRNRGERYYEASNHLGNVLTVTSDLKKFDTTSSSYKATVTRAQDYYPFGLEMSERSMADASYRFAFNGKERDTDGLGDQTHYDYGFRIYNPEIARFLSVDPISPEYPELTPYQFASNTPIQAIDVDGLEATTIIKEILKRLVRKPRAPKAPAPTLPPKSVPKKPVTPNTAPKAPPASSPSPLPRVPLPEFNTGDPDLDEHIREVQRQIEETEKTRQLVDKILRGDGTEGDKAALRQRIMDGHTIGFDVDFLREIGFITQDHHIIPQQWRNLKIVQDAIAQGFDFDGKDNILPVSILRHNGHHPGMNDYVGRILESTGNSENYDPSKARSIVTQFVENLRKTILLMDDKTINQIGNELLSGTEKDEP